MKPINKLEEKALEMFKQGKPIHGLLKDVLVDMQLRDMEETQEDQKVVGL
jgi:hypothetical protein